MPTRTRPPRGLRLAFHSIHDSEREDGEAELVGLEVRRLRRGVEAFAGGERGVM